MLSKYYLTANPFQKQEVTDISDFEEQPFIKTKTVKRFEIELQWAFPTGQPLFYNLVGARGIGKTATMVYLKKFIEKSKVDGKKFGVVYINRDFDRMSDDDSTIYKYIFNEYPDSIAKIKRGLKEYMDEFKHIFFLFDTQEIMTQSTLTNLAKFLEYIIRCHYGSIFITMNDDHYRKLQKITMIVGFGAKITTINLNDDFDGEFLYEVADRRLKKFRIKDYTGDPVYPFTIDSINEIARITSFTPRNFILGCNDCMRTATEMNKNVIDIELVNCALRQSYAENVIKERVKNEGEQIIFTNIIDTIKKDFNGIAPSMPELYKKLVSKGKYPLSYMTFFDWINKLEEFGLVKQERNFNTTRSNYVRLVV